MTWLTILLLWICISVFTLGITIFAYFIRARKEMDQMHPCLRCNKFIEIGDLYCEQCFEEQVIKSYVNDFGKGDGINTCLECGIPRSSYRRGCNTCHARLMNKKDLEKYPILPLDWDHDANCAKTKTLLDSQTNITIMPGAYMFIPCTCQEKDNV